MKRTMMRIFSLASIIMAAASGCASYWGDQPQCALIADCNPGKDCGQLIPCIDGRCDPGQPVELPCQKACATSQDCPAGMHCRYAATGPGTCVIDGSCADAAECLGFDRQACLGTYRCTDGRCVYDCLDLTACSQDSDCVLADKGCCCGSSVEDYVAVHRSRLDDWQNRPECEWINCPAIACMAPAGLQAICQGGECALDTAKDRYACSQDGDCVKVPIGCPSCDCASGYAEAAVNLTFEQSYLNELEKECAYAGSCQEGPYGTNACTNRPAVCVQGRCGVLGEDCDCGQQWNPACVEWEWERITLPDECQVDCLGLGRIYHGRCECQAQCDWGDPIYDTFACGANGVTYTGCGKYEVWCNGLELLYPGACDPACDYCAMLDGVTIPVCGYDFYDYPDVCYPECLGRDWWHAGQCLAGEGKRCGGLVGEACATEQLFCLIPKDCFDCLGTCIALGHCLEAAHCEDQLLPRDDCIGSWTCPNHTCTWVCE